MLHSNVGTTPVLVEFLPTLVYGFQYSTSRKSSSGSYGYPHRTFFLRRKMPPSDLKILVFWDVKLCSGVNRSRRFEAM
jgi:hypothetical protein